MAKKTQNPDEPLRGDAAWREAKRQSAERNAAAHARGRTARAASDEAARARRRAADLREATDMPVQPSAL